MSLPLAQPRLSLALRQRCIRKSAVKGGLQFRITGFQRLMGALQMLVLSLKFLVRCDEVMVAVA